MAGGGYILVLVCDDYVDIRLNFVVMQIIYFDMEWTNEMHDCMSILTRSA